MARDGPPPAPPATSSSSSAGARASASRTVLMAIAMIMIGCCANVVFLELIVKRDRGSGNLITFAQFLFIAIEGLIQHLDGFSLKKRVVPISYYLLQVLIYWAQSTINNKVFAFHIAMPLHMIFRASSLVASMTLGYVFLRKRYSLVRVISVIAVTIGIALATLASSKSANVHSNDEYLWWSVGIALLALGVFMAAGLGIVQEWTNSKFSKCPQESMFYIHALSLPFFAVVGGDIYKHALRFNDITERVKLGDVPIALPVMWLYLLGNVCTQWLCSRGVFTLMGSTNSLTCTLVLTLRKFISLLFSIWYFGNPFTVQHWIGTVLVFVGTWCYSQDEIRSKVAEGKKKQ